MAAQVWLTVGGLVARSSVHAPDPSLDLNGFSGSAILACQPVVAEMQIHPRRRDRAVTGLGLHRLDRHPRLTQPGGVYNGLCEEGIHLESGRAR
jgi:hypothetical protein